MAKFDPKAKAKRQKIIAGVLGLVLVAVLVIQGPKFLSMFSGSETAASEPMPAPAPAPSPAPTPTPGTPAATPGTPTPADGSAVLVDSDPAPQPADGQLLSFDRFESKDPFVPQISDVDTGTSAPPADDGAGGEAPPETGEPTGNAPEPQAAPTTKAAVLSVNGESYTVAVGATFPPEDPIFTLISLKGNTVKVGIVDGTYANGSQAITLTKGGKPVTLMNTADGTTYVLRFVRIA